MKKILIGIIGQKGSGKTTLANMLVEQGYVRKQQAIADGIRKVKQLFFDRYIEDDKSTTKNNRGATDTRILQDIGKSFRIISKAYFNHENVWLDYLFDQTQSSTVISDIRLMTEAGYLLQREGVLIFLNVSSDVRRTRCERRNGKKFSDEEWHYIAQDDTETGTLDIVDQYQSHHRFFVIDASKEPEDALKETVEKLRLQQHFIHPMFGEEPPIDKDNLWSWR